MSALGSIVLFGALIEGIRNRCNGGARGEKASAGSRALPSRLPLLLRNSQQWLTSVVAKQTHTHTRSRTHIHTPTQPLELRRGLLNLGFDTDAKIAPICAPPALAFPCKAALYRGRHLERGTRINGGPWQAGSSGNRNAPEGSGIA